MPDESQQSNQGEGLPAGKAGKRNARGGQVMSRFKVHYDKVDGSHRVVAVEAATGEVAIAELRHDMMLCLPEGSTSAEFDSQFRNFTFDGPVNCESAGREGAR